MIVAAIMETNNGVAWNTGKNENHQMFKYAGYPDEKQSLK